MSYAVTITESIKDILATPIGARVCLPWYGSRLHELIDKRVTPEFKADLARFTYEAVSKCEKRAKVEKISNVNVIADGKLSFSVHLDNGDVVNI